MKTNKTYRSLLDKSINSMLSAIEIYNKPNFSYREETFAILAVNAWELILKAHLLKASSYNLKHLYKMQSVKKRNGEIAIRQIPQLNRSNNPKTIGIFDVIRKLEEKKIELNKNLNGSIETLIEFRDNAIHFHNEKYISKELQEIGFSCIKNYMNYIKKWEFEIDLSKYNFYLMPLAYVDSKIEVDSVMTEEVNKYLSFIKSKVQNCENDDDFTIAISIDIKFNKSNSLDGIGMQYDPNGVPVSISEENHLIMFPFTDKDFKEKSKLRYLDFKQDKKFYDIMKEIKSNTKICYQRKLDPGNPLTSIKCFFSTNIFQTLDKYYTKAN